MLYTPSLRRAFTLIELLVVVAIIALLIAILLPALGRVRHTAKTTACLSNIRSLGQATAVYAGTNDNMIIPAVVTKSGATDLGYFCMIADKDVPNPGVPVPSGLSPGSLATYPGLYMRSVFICPETQSVGYVDSSTKNVYSFWENTSALWDKNLLPLNGSTPTSNNALVLQCSYGINGVNNNISNWAQPCPFLTDSTNGSPLRKMTQIRNASSTAFMYDGISVNAYLDITYRIAGRHGTPGTGDASLTGNTNVAFFDGHGETIDRKKLPNDPTEFTNSDATVIQAKHPGYIWRLDQTN
jgi:prepilin-type N-terminal cleavage/methylation domain-containing protein/prepilin-type processing-associated H-X9-DG protein